MVKKSGEARVEIVHSIYEQIPAFTDIFDEETFYIFVACFVCSTIVVVFILSRFITIKAVE
ncbi:uncharacterized protein LOC126737363 [Anthonomus grandis grandis]|uniref:uncharacterized protein LOC126737363 n=1 Tax=Anthonomus grandis grandis TaxID=2921223 RepID=UPI00216552FD|nr:uncharacterized protein LOC126737363 [Anthonomus grandis grandis]